MWCSFWVLSVSGVRVLGLSWCIGLTLGVIYYTYYYYILYLILYSSIFCSHPLLYSPLPSLSQSPIPSSPLPLLLIYLPFLPPLPFKYSRNTCRYLHILIYIQSSQSSSPPFLPIYPHPILLSPIPSSHSLNTCRHLLMFIYIAITPILSSDLSPLPSPLLFSFHSLPLFQSSFKVYVSAFIVGYLYLPSQSQISDPACFIGGECRVVQF